MHVHWYRQNKIRISQCYIEVLKVLEVTSVTEPTVTFQRTIKFLFLIWVKTLITNLHHLSIIVFQQKLFDKQP